MYWLVLELFAAGGCTYRPPITGSKNLELSNYPYKVGPAMMVMNRVVITPVTLW